MDYNLFNLIANPDKFKYKKTADINYLEMYITNKFTNYNKDIIYDIYNDVNFYINSIDLVKYEIKNILDDIIYQIIN